MDDDFTEPERYRPEGAEAERHYAAIGKVAAEWAEFEFVLDVRLLLLAGFRAKTGSCLTLQIIGPGRKLNAYMAIAELRKIDGATLRKIRKFQEKAFDLAERRNRVVHDQWMIFPSGATYRLEATANKTLVLKYKEHPTEFVEQLVVEIREFISRFEKLDEQVWAALKT